MKTTQENLQYLSSIYSKMLKRRFGKGPETCYVMLKGNKFFVYMRNFMTPAEEVLIENNELNIATNFRSAVMKTVTEEFIPEVSKVLGSRYDSFFHDWNFDQNTGILLLENPHANHEEKIDVIFGRTLLKLIKEVGSRNHKRPSSLKIVNYSPNICTIESKEVLLHLESLVYETGNYDLVLHRAREIKNGYLKHKNLFEKIFNRLIEDIFMIWDYQHDRSYLIFIFNKEYKMN